MSTEEKAEYVISLVDLDTGQEGFLYHDPECGYLMKWPYLSGAAFFTLEDAEKHLKALLDEKEIVYASGEKFPPDFIARGLDMSYAKMKARGALCIKRIELATIGTPVLVQGEIKRPTGFIYD